METPSRALITETAAELLRKLQKRHGPLMFHQSGGCCDGSSPMCYPDGDFIVGDRDILLEHFQRDVRPGRSYFGELFVESEINVVVQGLP